MRPASTEKKPPGGFNLMFNGLNHITPSLDCFFFVVVAADDDDDDGIYILFDNQRIKTIFFLSLLFFVEDELFSLISERKIKMNFYFDKFLRN